MSSIEEYQIIIMNRFEELLHCDEEEYELWREGKEIMSNTTKEFIGKEKKIKTE